MRTSVEYTAEGNALRGIHRILIISLPIYYTYEKTEHKSP